PTWGAPEAAANEDAEVVARPQVEQAAAAAEPSPPPAHLHLAEGAEQRRGEVAGPQLAPPLEHAHRPPGPGQAGGGDGAAVARAHDDDVVAVAHEGVRARQHG